MMGLPSRQTAQRDLPSHSRLKLRRTRNNNAEEEESAEEQLKRLKRELEEREKKISVVTPAPPPLIKLDGFDDADEVDSSSSDEDEEEEESSPVKPSDLALQKELERVKLEKKLKAEQTISGELISSTNPLLEKAPIERRWDDDVIFRNQAKGEPDKKQKRFVNDIVRSDAHKDFLKKHIL